MWSVCGTSECGQCVGPVSVVSGWDQRVWSVCGTSGCSQCVGPVFGVSECGQCVGMTSECGQ